MMTSKKIILTACVLALCGCSSVKKDLGLTRDAPDEFAVVKRAPLSLPPDYSLRPPVPGAESLTDRDMTEEARSKVFGAPKTAAGSATSGDDHFLSQLGTAGAQSDIRTQIDKERGIVSVKDRAVADKIIFWKEPEEHYSIVDPKAEAERLKKNKDEGAPVNAGDVPTIEKKPSVIDKLF